jgi:putative copper export protein
MMFVVVVPAIRSVSDARSRIAILQRVTVRFAYLGFGALALLVVTGIDNIDRYAPADLFEYRYGYILVAKVIMLVLVLILTAIHTFLVGPRLLNLMAMELDRPGQDDNGQTKTWRLRSVMISALTLLFSLAIIFCAALLQSSYSYGGA